MRTGKVAAGGGALSSAVATRLAGKPVQFRDPWRPHAWSRGLRGPGVLQMTEERQARVADIYERHRRELVVYVSRLVVHRAVAEEIAQEAVMRLLLQQHVAEDESSVRAWLYRVSTNLALDHLRRHSTSREFPLLEARRRAETDMQFVKASQDLRGSPETKAIAREHLVACFACTLRNLPAEHAAALLLKEVYGFSTQEVADMLDARFAQVKNWVQAAREQLTNLYSTTCALVTKQGVCFQCVELDRYFNDDGSNPLQQSADLDARLSVLRDLRHQPLGPWHSKLFELVRQVID